MRNDNATNSRDDEIARKGRTKNRGISMHAMLPKLTEKRMKRKI